MIQKPSLYDDVKVENKEKLCEGGYICVIKSVEYVESKNYIKLGLDIAEGRFKNYFESKKNNDGSWCYDAIAYLSLKNTESAIKSFKGVITAIENSNGDYKWDWNEKSLYNKKVGAIVGMKEYALMDGSVKTKAVIKWLRSTDTIRDGKFKVPELETLVKNDDDAVSSFMKLGNTVKNQFNNNNDFGIDDDDLPF